MAGQAMTGNKYSGAWSVGIESRDLVLLFEPRPINAAAICNGMTGYITLRHVQSEPVTSSLSKGHVRRNTLGAATCVQ